MFLSNYSRVQASVCFECWWCWLHALHCSWMCPPAPFFSKKLEYFLSSKHGGIWDRFSLTPSFIEDSLDGTLDYVAQFLLLFFVHVHSPSQKNKTTTTFTSNTRYCKIPWKCRRVRPRVLCESQNRFCILKNTPGVWRLNPRIPKRNENHFSVCEGLKVQKWSKNLWNWNIEGL